VRTGKFQGTGESAAILERNEDQEKSNFAYLDRLKLHRTQWSQEDVNSNAMGENSGGGAGRDKTVRAKERGRFGVLRRREDTDRSLRRRTIGEDLATLLQERRMHC
jgi:hypothetical protein